MELLAVLAGIAVAVWLSSMSAKNKAAGAGVGSDRRSVPVNHGLHWVLALFTAGLWLIPYVVILVRNPPSRR